MLHAIMERIRQGHRTTRYPREEATLPERFRGYPELSGGPCPPGCAACVDACPFGAVARAPRLCLDMGRCLFCRACEEACPHGRIRFTNDPRLAANRREELVVAAGEAHRLAHALEEKMLSLFGRSLKFRSVVAGGCNACEADTNVLSTVGFDLSRFGIQFVASPRHADGLLICGPVTRNMELALRKTYDAVPGPKVVIAVGACAIAGGPYFRQEEQLGGASTVLPVDLFIPGCPPHPLTILDGLLRLLGRLEGEGRIGIPT